MIKMWQAEIEEITSDVEDLLYSKYQAEELERIIKANNFVMLSVGSFWEHFKLNYTYFVISKIWHQVDEDNRSLSLINLLKDLLEHHDSITKSWWVSRNPTALSPREFEENFGKEEYLDPDVVREDIKKLKETTKEIIEFRHKRVGHKDKGGKFSSHIGGQEINKAVRSIETLVKKYQLLLTQSGYESLTPMPDDWQKAFTKAWIQS